MALARDEVNTLRGLACILLVSYHVVGTTVDSGLRIDNSIIHYIGNAFSYIRMPLFTVISGYVYANKPLRDELLKFFTGKLRRLILPLLTVGTIFAILQSMVPGSSGFIQDWSTLHIFPVAHYWFIESLFFVFLIIMALEYTKILSSKEGAIAAFAGAALLSLSSVNIPYFSINGAIYLLPYFMLGLLLNRFDLLADISKPYVYAMCLISVVAVMYFGDDKVRSIDALIIGCFGCYSLFLLKINSRALANIGMFSYVIYLLHPFFTSLSRMVFLKSGFDFIFLAFISGLMIGLAGPIVVEKVFNKFPIFGLIFLGKRLVKKQTLSSLTSAKVTSV